MASSSTRAHVPRAAGAAYTPFVEGLLNITASAEIDKLAIEAIGAALSGAQKPFVVTSAIGLLAPGERVKVVFIAAQKAFK